MDGDCIAVGTPVWWRKCCERAIKQICDMFMLLSEQHLFSTRPQSEQVISLFGAGGGREGVKPGRGRRGAAREGVGHRSGFHFQTVSLAVTQAA